MRNFVPWLVTALIVFLMGNVFWSYATWLPVRIFDVFLMAGMSVSAVVIVAGFFRVYAILDRMDKR